MIALGHLPAVRDGVAPGWPDTFAGALWPRGRADKPEATVRVTKKRIDAAFWVALAEAFLEDLVGGEDLTFEVRGEEEDRHEDPGENIADHELARRSCCRGRRMPGTLRNVTALDFGGDDRNHHPPTLGYLLSPRKYPL